MTDPTHKALRSSGAYKLARAALRVLEAYGVAPTPVALHLCVGLALDPAGELARDLVPILGGPKPVSEARLDDVASKHLSRTMQQADIDHLLVGLNHETELFMGEIQREQRYGSEFLAFLAEPGESLEEARLQMQRQVNDRLDTSRSFQKNLEEAASVVRTLQEFLSKMKSDASVDALTLLQNRRSFEAEWQRLIEGEGPLTIALFDVDRFKVFNDTWGHQTGDQVLRYVGETIALHAPRGAFAARYGGEEFAVLFPGHASSTSETDSDAIRLAVKARSLIKRQTGDDLGFITVSCGLATRRQSEEGASMLNRADLALYASKAAGRDRVTVSEIAEQAGARAAA